MNALIQNILAFSTVFLAVAYLVNKFLLPSRYKLFGKRKATGCGQDDCGCH